jgi:integrase
MVTCMMEIFKVIAHLLSTLVRAAEPGGVRAVLAESLLLKHQLLVLSRPRNRAPRLRPWDRLLFGIGALLVAPNRNEGPSREDPQRTARPSAVATLSNYGLRREELYQLKIKDIHPLRGIRHLRVHGKGNKTHCIPLHAGTHELLNALPCQSIRQRAGHMGKSARFYERVQVGGYHQYFECSHVTG